MHLEMLRLVVLLQIILAVVARQDLKLEDDQRRIIPLLEFGFMAGGKLDLSIQNQRLLHKADPNAFIGVFVRHSERLMSSLELDSGDGCPATSPQKLDTDETVDIGKVNTLFKSRKVAEDGYWMVYLINCDNEATISADITYRAINPKNNHLSLGDMPLPRLYFFAAVIYSIFVIAFVRLLRAENVRVFWIHRLMLLLLILTVLQKTFLSIQYYSLKAGVDTEAYVVLSYIFTLIKSSLAVTIIGLLAAGWSFIKPYLSDRDRKLILFIIPLQITANIAKIMESELAIGSANWIIWSRILPVVDIASFLIILYAIIQTRKHLTQASETDGKAKSNLTKYKLWGTLYVTTCAYLYLTRIISLFIESALSFHLLWLSEAFNEFVTGSFYLFIGTRFRPSTTNPYTEVDRCEDDDSETGLQLRDLYADLDEDEH